MPRTGPIQLDEIVHALELLGGEAQAKYIKDKVTDLRGGMPSHYGRSHSYRETIQKKIEDHCPQSANYREANDAYFEKVRRGVYRLIKKSPGLSLKYENVLDEIEELKDTYIDLDETTRKSVIDSRIGQGTFRDNLISLWGGCSVTGCGQLSLLVASHIKPWRDSKTNERLDPYNGLLLLPNLDKAFDLGFISFETSGNILISSRLQEYDLLGLSKGMSIKVKEQNKHYLDYHCSHVYQST